jgi:mono/diheme cytochrome c family protein
LSNQEIEGNLRDLGPDHGVLNGSSQGIHFFNPREETAMSALHSLITATAVLAAATAQYASAQTPNTADSKSIERGRYVVKIAGCNDCHTPGYTQTGGKVPEQQWLTGDQLGWRGPWGTTYPSNLRLYLRDMSEDQWLKIAKTAQFRPPMPWFALHAMSPQDLRAVFRFVKHLGPAGETAPAYVPPGQEPKGPFVLFPQPPK